MAKSTNSKKQFPLDFLRVFSLNCNKANYIGHACLNSLVSSTGIILFQEPWVSKVGSRRLDSDPKGSDIYGNVHQNSWSQFIPVPHLASSNTPVRATAYVNCHIPHSFSFLQRTDLIEHLDIVVLEVRSPSLNLLLVNVYNGEDCDALQTLTSTPFPDLPIIITGDFNLHHPIWSSPDTQESTNASLLVDWMETNNFALINPPEQITFERGFQQSVLDLTWANQAALPLITDWTIHSNATFGSDHLPVSWRFGNPNVPTEPPPKFNFKEELAGGWITAFKEYRENNPITLPSSPTTPDLLSVTDYLHTALHETSLLTVKAKPPHPQPSPWFVKEVIEALKAHRRCRKRFRRYRNNSTSITDQLSTFRQLVKSCNKLRRTIAKAKRDWAYDFASKVKPNKIWSLNSWYKGLRRYAIPPITSPITGERATTDEQKDDLFRKAFFPPPPVVHTPPFDTSIPHHKLRPFTDVTIDEIRQHPKKTSNTSTPGLSGISYCAIKWAWEVDPDLIHYVLKWSLRLGVHHNDWKKSIMVIIPKPNKPSYSIPGAYRPIQLLECLGKLLEKIVAKRLMFECSRYNLVPPEQFGGVSSASCVDAGLSLTHDIEHALNRKLTASLLTIDVKGFFDNVNHNRLISILYHMGFPTPITNWVSSFLSNRSAASRIGTFTGPFTPIDTGVPQGSPCSPILSVIYSTPILEAISLDPLCTNILLPVIPRSYIDDFSFLAISHSDITNTTALEGSLHQTVALFEDAGMRIDPSKSELIHFSWGRKPCTAPITTTLYGKDLRINPKDVVRWLSIFFDSKLRFSKHVEIMCN